jgi:hypothetical protein
MFTPKLHAERSRPPAPVLIKHICSESVWGWEQRMHMRIGEEKSIAAFALALISDTRSPSLRARDVSLSLCFTCVCQSSILKVVRDPHESGAQREQERGVGWYLILSHSLTLWLMLAEAWANTRALLTRLLLPRLSPLAGCHANNERKKTFRRRRGARADFSPGARSDDAADGGWNLYANFCRCSNKQVVNSAHTHTRPSHTGCPETCWKTGSKEKSSLKWAGNTFRDLRIFPRVECFYGKQENTELFINAAIWNSIWSPTDGKFDIKMVKMDTLRFFEVES